MLLLVQFMVKIQNFHLKKNILLIQKIFMAYQKKVTRNLVSFIIDIMV